jgi:hypothetical protein
MGTDDVGHLGAGWYDLEADERRAFRWMKRSAVFHLNALAAETIGIHVQLHHPDLTARPVQLTFRVAGSTTSREIRDYRWQDVEISLPRITSGPIAVELTLDRDWIPARCGVSGDRRALGLRMHRCWSR